MSTTARVQVTLDINVGSSWTDDVKVNQVRKQAVDDALGKIGRLVENSRNVRVVGKPIVTVVSSVLSEPPHD